jgi:general secretion pathway protein L
VQIGISLPGGRIFGRQLLIPAEASQAIDAIVAQDTARRTPFRQNDVVADHVIAERLGGKLRVLQWIVRRDDVHNALTLLKLPLEKLAFITCEGTSTEKRPLIRLHRNSEAGQGWYRKTMLALSCAGVLLAVTASGLKYWNQQVTLERLETEIAATNKKAQQIRGLVDRLQEKQVALLNLRKQKSEGPRMIAIWDEVTRILPGHSWLTELRIAEMASRETQIALSGFSGAAPSLVGIVDRSPLFVDAALSAPVALDPTEGRERFALQARVKRPDLAKGDVR